MKAVLFDAYGGPEVLVTRDVPDPEPGPGEVRVRVKLCAINLLALFGRRGIPGRDLPLPHVGGSDVAGTVDMLGPGVTGWTTGQRVIVNPSLWCGRCAYCEAGNQTLCDHYRILGEHVWGGCAEYVVVPAINLSDLPERFSFADGAAVPLTFQTAWRALFTQADLRAGETILVLGASGGVAVAAIQMARMAGATVYAVTAGPDSVERTRSLGADVVLDRNEVDFGKAVWVHTGKRGVDVVLENVGAATWKSSIRSLARGGRLVTYGATTGPIGETNIALLFWKQITLRGSTMGGPREFAAAMDAFRSGRVRPIVHEVLPLDDLRVAHEHLEAGQQFGKIVLEVGG